MRLTPALYVRQLLAKLQPPFPRTVRESKQLLNVLETSFRRHLDETHPAPVARANEEPAQQVIPLHSAHSASHATQHHLHSLLTHPLLDAKAGKGTSHVTHIKNAVEQYQHAFAQGLITVELLKRCVDEYCLGIRNGEAAGHNDKLGPRLAAWVHSADLASKEQFFLNPVLLGRALTVMAFDHEETTVWTWLRMVYERDLGYLEGAEPQLTDPNWLALEDNLVSNLMRYSIRRKDLDDAAQQFAEACRYRVISGRDERNQSSHLSQSPLTPMNSSWDRLAASIILTRADHGISAPRFDAALAYGSTWTTQPFFNEAVLNVYHPVHPSAQLLSMNLRNPTTQAAFTRTLTKSNKAMNRAILTTLLDGAQLSIDQNMPADANLLLEFASENFSGLVPAAKLTSQSSIQERILQMLRALDTLRPGSVQLKPS